jgi:branched-chain amino acid transport system substrate-binding protein
MDIPFPQREINVTQVTPELRAEARRADLERRRGILAGVDLFRNLPESTFGPLAERLQKHEFAGGEVIIRQGDSGDSLYIIRNGEVGVRLAVEGSEREVAVLKAGAFFGEMSLLTGEARKATCVAKGDCICYVLDRDGFEVILQANEAIAADISNTLAKRQTALEAERSGLNAAATAKSAEATSKHILGRIKNFFRLKPQSFRNATECVRRVSKQGRRLDTQVRRRLP